MLRIPDKDHMLAYLLQTPDERSEKGIGNWYRGLPVVPFSDPVPQTLIAEAFQYERSTVSRLLESGFFGTKGSVTWRGRKHTAAMQPEIVNSRLREYATLIPWKSLLERCNEERWYMGEAKFFQTFGDYSTSFPGKHEVFVTVPHAAKIIAHGRRRRSVIEEWPTVWDLHRESGIDISPSTYMNRFKAMLEAGEADAVRVGIYRNGSRAGWQYKIPPWAYRHLLDRERSIARNLRMGVSESDLAEELGMKPSTVRYKLSRARSEGNLSSLYLGGSFRVGIHSFLYDPSQARRILKGEETGYDSRPLIQNLPMDEGVLLEKALDDRHLFNFLVESYAPLVEEINTSIRERISSTVTVAPSDVVMRLFPQRQRWGNIGRREKLSLLERIIVERIKHSESLAA